MPDPGFSELLEYKSLTAGRTDYNMVDSKFTPVSILQKRVKLLHKSVWVNAGLMVDVLVKGFVSVLLYVHMQKPSDLLGM